MYLSCKDDLKEYIKKISYPDFVHEALQHSALIGAIIKAYCNSSYSRHEGYNTILYHYYPTQYIFTPSLCERYNENLNPERKAPPTDLMYFNNT